MLNKYKIKSSPSFDQYMTTKLKNNTNITKKIYSWKFIYFQFYYNFFQKSRKSKIWNKKCHIAFQIKKKNQISKILKKPLILLFVCRSQIVLCAGLLLCLVPIFATRIYESYSTNLLLPHLIKNFNRNTPCLPFSLSRQTWTYSKFLFCSIRVNFGSQ